MPRFARNGELDLEKILGKLLNQDGNVVMMRNIRTRKPMKSAHHCDDKECNGIPTMRCIDDLHICFCVAPVVDEDPTSETYGQVVICGERYLCVSQKGCAIHTFGMGFNIDVKDARHDYRNIEFTYQQIFDDFKARYEQESALRAEKDDLLRKQLDMTEHQFRRYVKTRDQVAYRKKCEDAELARQQAAEEELEMQNDAREKEAQLQDHVDGYEPELLHQNPEDAIQTALGDLPVEQATPVTGDEAATTNPPMPAATEDDHSSTPGTDTQRLALPENHQDEEAFGQMVWGHGPPADPRLAGILEAEAAVEGTTEQDTDQARQVPDRLRRKENKEAKKLRAAQSHSMAVSEAIKHAEEERKAIFDAEQAKRVANLRSAKGATGAKGGSKTGVKGGAKTKGKRH